MSFQPNAGDEMVINGVLYRVGQHPAAPGLAYAQAGRQGIVYQLIPASGKLHEAKALKVFFPKYRIPAMVYQSEMMEMYSESPGLQVCRRDVLTPERNESLIAEHPDLLYGVLMPWIYGHTWFDIVTDQRRLLRGESLALAKGLSAIGSGMEQRGLAHCDLSAPNVMLPFFSEVELPEPRSVIELVDIEQMYSPKLDRPDVLLAGSPGYAAHRTVQSGLWSGYADRFAGAVIIAEMLGWCDPLVVEKAWGESYFDQPELQNPCERYFILKNSLERNWGAKTAELFARAWESQDLSSCPTFGEWLVLLSTMTERSENADESVTEKQDADTVLPAESAEPLVSAPSPALQRPAVPTSRRYAAAAAEQAAALTKGEEAASGDQEVVNRLFHQARELESSGNLSGALEVYKSAHHFVSKGSPMEIELEAAIRGLESELNPPGPDRKLAKVPFYQSRKWLTSAVVVILLLAGTAFAVNQIVADHSPGKQMEAGAGTKAGGEKAQTGPDADQTVQKQEEADRQAELQRQEAEQREEEARKQAEAQRLKAEAERKRLEEARKAEERKKQQEQYAVQAKYDAYLQQLKEKEKKKEAVRKQLQEMYKKQAQYEAYLAFQKEKEAEARAEAEAARKAAEAKAQQLKQKRSGQVVQLIAYYNQAFNAQRGGNIERARSYAKDFARLYEQDATYFKAVGKVGTRASAIYKFLSNGSYSLPDV
ncbi:hypothetical protein FHS19_000662 [Paenibacillus rhizosphaerae]|uniref:Protein kinase domain-containing protein n=1 Tax=Paenibacillus rhizosphaerae TaxID=297318 RepID=A0A839TKS5_9BACL|nr:hypothetical protein [Paenibacillus rhizosphaerae]MBB3126008.1 hypothetical protein [Paenibacillus rhizosphaerae]